MTIQLTFKTYRLPLKMTSTPSSEVKSITGKLSHVLTIALSRDPLGVAGKLLNKGLKMLTTYIPAYKAAIVIAAVTKTIERSPAKFDDFLDILSEQICAREVVDSLRSTYECKLK